MLSPEYSVLTALIGISAGALRSSLRMRAVFNRIEQETRNWLDEDGGIDEESERWSVGVAVHGVLQAVNEDGKLPTVAELSDNFRDRSARLALAGFLLGFGIFLIGISVDGVTPRTPWLGPGLIYLADFVASYNLGEHGYGTIAVRHFRDYYDRVYHFPEDE